MRNASSGLGPAGDHEPRGEERVARLEAPDQRQPRAERPPAPVEPQILPVGVEALCGDAQIRPGLGAHGEEVLAPLSRDGGHLQASLAVDVDDGGAVLGQDAIEEPRLRSEVVLDARVIVEVVAAEVGEARRAQPHPVEPPLRQAVGGRLHRRVGHAGRRHLRQQAVERDGLGRGVAQGRGVGALHPGGAEVGGGQAHRLPDLAGEGGHGGLAVGAGDGGHHLGLGAEPQRRRAGQRLARILRHHERGAAKRPRRQRRAVAVRQDGRGAPADRGGRMGGAVDAHAGERSEEMAGAHLAAVHRQARDPRRPPALRGESQIR